MPTLTVNVAAGPDDAYQAGDGYMNNSWIDIQVYSDLSPSTEYYRRGGLRFQNVTLPPGSIISEAILRVRTTYDVTANCIIYGEAVDNSPDFSTPIIPRTRTIANVPWAETLPVTSPVSKSGLAAIIQEIVNRSGWVFGNALTLLLVPNTNVAAAFRFFSFEGGYPAQLEITYTVGIPELAISVSPTSAILTVGQQQIFAAVPSGGVAPYTVTWIDNANGNTIGSGMTYTFTATVEGTFSIKARVQDNSGATVDSSAIAIQVSPAPPTLYRLRIESSPISGVEFQMG